MPPTGEGLEDRLAAGVLPKRCPPTLRGGGSYPPGGDAREVKALRMSVPAQLRGGDRRP